MRLYLVASLVCVSIKPLGSMSHASCRRANTNHCQGAFRNHDLRVFFLPLNLCIHNKLLAELNKASLVQLNLLKVDRRLQNIMLFANA